MKTRPLQSALTVTLKCLAGASLLALVTAECRADPPPKNPYSTMAPLEQYLMPRDAEIALARSAGPESITRDAEVLVFGARGYETAVPGRNGFVCAVQRAWAAPIDDPEFWNPKVRAPICWNPAGARYCVPLMLKKTKLVLEGKSKAEIVAGIRAALGAGEFPPLGTGAMCFMMSKGGHLSDRDGHWHPHLMFFLHQESAAAWGATSRARRSSVLPTTSTKSQFSSCPSGGGPTAPRTSSRRKFMRSMIPPTRPNQSLEPTLAVAMRRFYETVLDVCHARRRQRWLSSVVVGQFEI
jgi:hypothetical protein